MKTLATLEPLTTRLLEIRRIQSAAAVLSWDQETYMPAGGGAARAEQIATLEGLAHQRLVSAELETLLTEWIDPATAEGRGKIAVAGGKGAESCHAETGEKSN